MHTHQTDNHRRYYEVPLSFYLDRRQDLHIKLLQEAQDGR